MKKTLAVLFTLFAAVPLIAQTKTRYLISMRRPPALSSLRLTGDAGEIAAHDVRTFKNLDYIAADLTDAEAASLRASIDVSSIAPVVVRSIETVETPVAARPTKSADSKYSRSQTVGYGIDLVHARDVWSYTRAEKTVNVAIVDTGIDYTHPDLKERYQGGFNAFTKGTDPMDDHGHGSHVAGIIGATDNDFGVVGVAPLIRIWSAKVLNASGSGTDETVMAGIDWVINKKRELGGNWIINLSLGSEAASDAERAMFARAIDENILIVAAAGNRGGRSIDYPGAYDRVLAISAIDSNNKLAAFSSFGPGVAFAAPGVNVLSTFRVGGVTVAGVDEGAKDYPTALPLSGSALGEITADTIYCGYGRPEDMPATGVTGKIALMTRGQNVYFRDKVRNALTAGAVAAVIIPPLDDPATNRDGWTLLVTGDDFSFKWPIVVSVENTEGKTLIDNAGKVPLTLSYTKDDYTLMSGTSMATPHVTGVAALVWSLAPDATAEQMRLALKLSAFDLGAKDHDEKFGYGRIDAIAAAKYVAPALFGLPPTKPPVLTRRRGSSPQPHN